MTHASKYVLRADTCRIRQHTSAYVSIRDVSIRQHASAYVSKRQHTSAYVSIGNVLELRADTTSDTARLRRRHGRKPYCFTAALLLLYCCYLPVMRRELEGGTDASLTAALLLLYCCFTTDTCQWCGASLRALRKQSSASVRWSSIQST
jgi:hypothetical protein